MDYKKLGFKCGLEVHAQLNTNKLFCNCPSLVNDPNKNFTEVKRKLSMSESELGEKDIAAEYESKKQKTFIYQAKPTSSCLVELDCEPPHPINQEALKTGIQVCKLLSATIVNEVLVMRKLVIDGSNVTGFQRTALLGRKGFIRTSKGKISIPTIYIEEEAAKKIKEDKETKTYSLDRLGIPLLEISTSPDLQDPEHVKEAASTIGMIVKSTGNFKSGIGSIRQDVNISIKGHERVELKGFQDLKAMPKTIDIEIKRQLKSKSEKAHVRKVEPNFTSSFLRPMPGSARMYPETDIPSVELPQRFLKQIEIPELISERAINFEKKYNISEQYAREILKLNIPFDYYAEKYKVEPKFIAHLLIELPKELKARFKTKQYPKKQHFDFVLENLEKNKITRESTIEILKELVEGKKPDLLKLGTASLGELEDFIKEIVSKNPGVSTGGLMGDVMKKYRGKVDGSLVMKLVKKYQK